jgi:hypothetical protein
LLGGRIREVYGMEVEHAFLHTVHRRTQRRQVERYLFTNKY